MPRIRNGALLCKARLLAPKSCSIPALPVTVGAGCPSRFAGGQRTVFGLSSGSGQGQSAVQPGLGCHASKTVGFVHAGLAVQAPISEHFMHPPASQPLKPQSSMPERFCTSPFASAAQHICRSLGSQGRRTSSRFSSSKQERVGSQQPPNPSLGPLANMRLSGRLGSLPPHRPRIPGALG